MDGPGHTASAIKILLVEDSPSDAELLQHMLQRTGVTSTRFELTWVERLQDAMARLRDHSFDVLLLDLTLPDSSGPETFRRARDAAPRLPIVVLTGASDEDLGPAAVHEGIQDYLVKGEADARQIARAIRYAIERKHAEDALRQQREWFSVTLNSIGDAVLATDTAGRITFVNPVAARLTGWPANEAVGQPVQNVFRIINEQSGETADDLVGRVLREGSAAALANHRAIVTRDGRVIPVEDSAAPIRDSSGAVAGAVVVFHDVTEKRRVQEALRRAQEIANVGSWELDRVNDRLTWSDETFRIFGFEPQEFTPSEDKFFELVHPEDREAVAAAYTSSAEENKAFFELPHRIVRKGGGEVRWVHSKCEHVRDAEGAVVRSIGMVQDMTDRKRAEEQLRQRQKLESLGVLAGGIAHDFNNILVGVVGNASLAAEMVPQDSPAVEILGRVLKAGEHAAHLTRQMLAYAGKGQFVVEAVNWSELARDASALVSSSISKKITLTLQLDRNVPPVESDASQMQQVFLNLALNAAEAIGDRAGEITITTSETTIDARYVQERLAGWPIQAGRYVSVEVRDTGCGMDEATRSRIFDPFFTTKFQGRGLGLAAVAGIVRAHKGAIQVTSAPGAGTTFRILLPAMPSNRRPRAAAAQPAREVRGSGTVMVVDDEETVRDLARKALEQRGYEVLIAESGPAAIEIVRSEGDRIRVAVLDLSMPALSGEETLPVLHKLRPELPVIVSSGYTEAEALRPFAGQTVAAFLQKPYTAGQLAGAVAAALKNSVVASSGN